MKAMTEVRGKVRPEERLWRAKRDGDTRGDDATTESGAKGEMGGKTQAGNEVG